MKVPMGPPPPKSPNPEKFNETSRHSKDPQKCYEVHISESDVKPSESPNSMEPCSHLDPKPTETPNSIEPIPETACKPIEISSSIDTGSGMAEKPSEDSNSINPVPKMDGKSVENSDSVKPTSVLDEKPSEPASSIKPVLEIGVKSSEITRSTQLSQAQVAPYAIPPWSEPPGQPYFLEVLKDGSIIDNFDVSGKGAYMFGRVNQCDFILEHPTISRFHAVLQYRENGEAFVYDLGSTHGTFINKIQLKPKVYKELHVGDVLRFGLSSRLYIFQGPIELMPLESDLHRLRESKMQRDLQDREASILRAKADAAMADGIQWGMMEDAIEEASEDNADEITWQTYKGQLTEKQAKTRDKVVKRYEKIAHMKKEIDSIQAKEIAQGGLTQGQQTQIARNEQRISQIMEEIESLEETLNESIQESIGAHAGKTPYHKKKGTNEDEEEVESDDDEFYDRTKKPSIHNTGCEKSSVETADTLLDKKEIITSKIENLKNLILKEEKKEVAKNEGDTEGGDALDAYMTGVSSQLVLDKTTQLQKELSILQSELDRVLYLLKIADPTGEATKKRQSKPQPTKSAQLNINKRLNVNKKLQPEPNRQSALEKPMNGSLKEEKMSKEEMPLETQITEPNENNPKLSKEPETEGSQHIKPKHQWLGAALETKPEISLAQDPSLSAEESSQFVDYKDRKKALVALEKAKIKGDSTIEDAAPGLIIRKRKPDDEQGCEVGASPEVSKAEVNAADAVALLLKHTRGYFASEDAIETREEGSKVRSQSLKEDQRKSRRKMGPEKPAFLEDNGVDSEAWVPPQGQTGDGRTSLNDRYGY